MEQKSLWDFITGGQHAVTSILVALICYMVLMVLGFFFVYSAIDFPKHFNLADGVEDTASTRLYYSLSIQATVMSEIYPKTTLARSLVMAQVLSGWIPTLLLVVPWMKAARRR